LENANKLHKDDLRYLIEETRLVLGLRHTPLLCIISAIKSRNKDIRMMIGNELSPKILATPKDCMDLIAAYRTYGNERGTIPHQLKKLIEKALRNFDEYQLAKYGRNLKNSKAVNLVDVFNLVHPKPKNSEQGELWGKLIRGELKPPMTWEVLLSASRTDQDKYNSWKQLLDNHKLPALATIRNIRNMLKVGISEKEIANYIDTLKSQWIFPYQILISYIIIEPLTKTQYIQDALINYIKRLSNNTEKLKGMTYIVLDISGSMGRFETNTYLTRALTVLYAVAINCEEFRLFVTSGNDSRRKHATEEIQFSYDFSDLIRKIENKRRDLGYGGIFTAQCINWIKNNYDEPERLVVISDSQDCDTGRPVVPEFGKFMYNNNIAPYHGVAYSEEKPWVATITVSLFLYLS